MGKTPPQKLQNRKKKEEEGEDRRTQDGPPSTTSFEESINCNWRKQGDAKGFVKLL